MSTAVQGEGAQYIGYHGNDHCFQNHSQSTVIRKESCALTGECHLPPGGDGCPLCLQLLLPLLMLIVILLLAFWIRQKYKASKFYWSFSIVFHGFWIQTKGEVRRKGKGNQKWM